MADPAEPTTVAGPLVCVIPALNAERTVAGVVASLRRVAPRAVVIGVDDGSGDRTRAVLAHACDRVVAFDANRGKGAALRAGFALATERYPDAAVLTLDADGQHDSAFVPRLVDALATADIVVGARHIAANVVPRHRRLANALSTGATRLITGIALTDSQSGFRLLRPAVLREVRARGDRYEYETDFLVRASRAGFRVVEVPVPTIYGPPSHFRELADAWLVARVLWSHRAALFR